MPFGVSGGGAATISPTAPDDWKQSVRAATTAAGTLSSDFENGDTVDGVALVTGDRILIKDQAAGAENGIYTVNASGEPTRANDYTVGITAAGTVCTAEEGTANADKAFQCTNNVGSDVVGTDALVFVVFGATAGEANTASNVGVGGIGIFKQKTGVDLQLRNINAGSPKITVALDGANNEVDVDAVPDEAEFILSDRIFS